MSYIINNGLNMNFKLDNDDCDDCDEIPCKDNVNNPLHYTNGNIECIDYIKEKLNKQQFQGFCLGNCIKYLSRSELKNGIEDLKKCQVYLQWAIDNIEDKPLTRK